jgi:hypothetical protein
VAAGDQVVADLDPVQLAQVRLDVAHRHPAGVHRDDLLVEAVEAPLVLRHDLRLERPLAVAQLVRKLRRLERIVRADVDRRQSPIGELIRQLAFLSSRPAAQASMPERRTRLKSGPAYTENRTDPTRLAYVEVLDDEKGSTAAGFHRRAIAFFRPLRDPSRTDPDRQRLLLPRDRARARLPHARNQGPSAHGPTGRGRTAKPNASSAP